MRWASGTDPGTALGPAPYTDHTGPLRTFSELQKTLTVLASSGGGKREAETHQNRNGFVSTTPLNVFLCVIFRLFPKIMFSCFAVLGELQKTFEKKKKTSYYRHLHERLHKQSL